MIYAPINFKPDPRRAADWPAPLSAVFGKLIDYEDPEITGLINEGEAAQALGLIGGEENFSRESELCKKTGDSAFPSPVIIKTRGSNIHTIPGVLGQFSEVFRNFAAYGARHDPLFLYRTGSLTIRQSRVKAEKPQVILGQHRDDTLGTDKEPLLAASIILFIADRVPPLVQTRPVQNAFRVLEEGEKALKSGLYREAKPYEVNLVNNFSIHTPGVAPRALVKTFLRVIYDGLPLDAMVRLEESLRRAMPDALKRRLDTALKNAPKPQI